MLRNVVSAGALVAAMALGAGPASARTLQAELLDSSKVRIDGMLREWHGEIVRLGQVLKGKATGDPAVQALLGYDENNLYVALKVTDGKLVSSGNFGRDEDHAEVTLAFPTGKGSYTTETVWLFPGVTGKSAGAVRRAGGGTVKGAKIVEAPTDVGYTLEAEIPWSAFREARRMRVGLRGALRYVDADTPGKVVAVIGTGEETSGAALPRLMLESEQAVEDTVNTNNLGSKPAYELYGDVAGDALYECVAVYKNYLTIAGPGYKDGKEYFYAELGVPDASWITRFELRDVDGDGKDEIVMQKRVGGEETYREVLIIQKPSNDGPPRDLFLHDVAIVTPEGQIRNQVKLTSGKRGLTITIAQDAADYSSQEVFAGATQEDIPSTLLPWEGIGSQTFEWDGSAFKKTGENKTAARGPRGAGKKKHKPAGPPPPPVPRPPSADELMDKVYALYRKDRKLKAGKPRFDFVTDVVGDEQLERVLVHERDIVVFGAGFLGGTSYAFTTMGFAEPADVLDVTARDLTGDGKAEIIARGVLRAEAGEELGKAEVLRYALYVYGLVGDRMQRVFAAETGRALGENRVLAGIGFIPGDQGVTIELRPGRAVGWTARTYPFPEDTGPAGGLQPLPLPWAKAARTYRFDGSAFAGQ